MMRPPQRNAHAPEGSRHPVLPRLAEPLGKGPLQVEVLAAKGQRDPVTGRILLKLVPIVVAPGAKKRLARADEVPQGDEGRGEKRGRVHVFLPDRGQLRAKRRQPAVDDRAHKALKFVDDFACFSVHKDRADLDDLGLVPRDTVVFVAGRFKVDDQVIHEGQTAPVDDEAPGRDPGHQGFSWDDYVSWLVSEQGSLAAVAQRLAALRAWKDDAGSIERALRRLRARGQRDGGTWGARALLAFGLPDAATARTRWMGAYHSRFTDLPLPVCDDLLRLWDRPPLAEAPPSALFLALAQATAALRRHDRSAAAPHLQRARSAARGAPPDARAELLLIEGFFASDTALLAPLPALLGEPMAADDRACLHARYVDQMAYGHNQRGAYETSEQLYQSIPDAAPPFALSRRANGLAYLRHKQQRPEEAAALAREAASHAGDGGHLRIRGMALSMLARILGSPAGDEARRRALAIARSLDDESLRLRFEKPLPLTVSPGPSSGP